MKVGIIGGGAAGLTTAWLLDQECEVILFEQNKRLGGHAHTIFVQKNDESIPIEIGFEFFNAWLFPQFIRLLEALKVPINSFPLTYCFHTKKDRLILSSSDPNKLLKQLFNPSVLMTLLQFNYVLYRGKKFVKKRDFSITIEQFADALFLRQGFKDFFLYPFLTAGWGCRVDEFKFFSAYDILSWITKKPVSLKPQNWFEIVGGNSIYLEALVKELTKTSIKTESTIISLAVESGKYVILEKDGGRTIVDHVVIATDPQQAALLLKDVIFCEDIYKKLLYFESFPATVAVHGDQRFMPKQRADWSVANVYYDGFQSALTVYKPWKSQQGLPIFRSWLIENNAKIPENLYALEHFNHQKVTPRYFEAQHYLKSGLGGNNLWLAGSYMDNLDSHESAVASAIHIAQKLVPHSDRLRQLI